MEDKKFNLSSPWYTYQKEVKAFFDYDDEVEVSGLEEAEGGYRITVKVSMARKAFALKNILVPEIDFGGVKVFVDVECGEIADILESAFDKNAVVHKIESATMPGSVAEFIMLEPEVIQFQNDDISSPTKDSTFLAQTVARDIFDVFRYHGFICTVKIGEN